MKMIYTAFTGLLIFLFSLTATAQRSSFGKFDEVRLGAASCKVAGGRLIVNSGALERTYRLVPSGMQTISLQHTGEKARPRNDKAEQADWQLGLRGNAVLRDLAAIVDDDSGFTSRHISVTCTFDYPSSSTQLRYIIWIYPGSGIRTRIELKGPSENSPVASASGDQQVEYCPLDLRTLHVKGFGYYNNTERRNEEQTPILKEEDLPAAGSVDWANGLFLRDAGRGWILLKESHKCVNQAGVATGSFDIGGDAVTITGPGLTGKDLDTGRWVKCWASWIVPYTGDTTDALLTLKRFDRLRYPVGDREFYIMANTWGSGYARYASRQANVFAEIASQKDLGIDVQQIDDGWQDAHWRPRAENSFVSGMDTAHRVHFEAYPDGWDPVRKYAAKMGVTLGLWAGADIPEKDLEWNYQHGGFLYYKLDGAFLNTKKKLDALDERARTFILSTGHKVKVNWDVTENSPRFGYFYAREFGNIFLENREPISGSYAPITYKPHLVLRDAWHLAKYINLNKFQIPVQNVDKVNNLESDAFLYPNTYPVAITLMSSPIFFEETHFYAAADRDSIRNVLRVYKQYRDEMNKGFVFPIGDVPNNASWTGFQDYVDAGKGFLLLFRELHSQGSTHKIKLEFVHDAGIELVNLFTGEKIAASVDKDGFIDCQIPKAPDFRLFSYSITARASK